MIESWQLKVKYGLLRFLIERPRGCYLFFLLEKKIRFSGKLRWEDKYVGFKMGYKTHAATPLN